MRRVRDTGVIKAASIYVLGSFMVQGLNFITLPLFAALMTTDEFGIYTSYENWTILLATVIGFQTSASVTNAYVDYSEGKIRSYVSSVCFLAWVSSLIAGILTCIFLPLLTNLFELNAKELCAGIFQCLFLYFLNLCMTECRVLNRPGNYFIYSILNTGLTLAGGIGFLYLWPQAGPWGRILGSSIAACIVGGAAAITIYRQGKTWFDINNIKYALTLSSPLIFHALAGILMGKTDQMMLLKMTSPGEMGIYSYGNKIGHVAYVLYTAINQAFVPWYYRAKQEHKNKLIKRIDTIYINTFSAFCLCILLVMPEIIRLFSPSAYYGAVYTTPLIIAGFYLNFLYTFPVNYEFFHKETKYIAGGTILCAFINIVLNTLLIPLLGGIGAAITTIISYAVLLFIHLWIANKLIGDYELYVSFFLIRAVFMIIMIGVYFVIIDCELLRWGIAAVISISMAEKIVRDYGKSFSLC